MIGRVALFAFALALGVILSALAPNVPTKVRQLAGLNPPVKAGSEPEHGHDESAQLQLTDEQVAAAGIQLADVQAGVITRTTTVPGTIAANADRLAHVPAKVTGVVTQLRKKIGELVTTGDVLAVVESREIAEAKSEYLAALRSEQLAQVTYKRESDLWAKRVTAEQDFLKARGDAQEARIRVDLGRQKLSALGIGSGEIEAVGKGGSENVMRIQEVRSPLTGRVIERQATLGASIAGDTRLFIVADLTTLWIEMAVPMADLAFFKEGQAVTVTGSGGETAQGAIIFISPVIDPETRAARAVALMQDPEQKWRPGSFVTAAVAGDPQSARAVIPKDAIQTINGQPVVFVRTGDRFEPREVVLGRSNDKDAEVVFGIDPGDRIAGTGSFALKAQLGKSEAEHSH